LWRKEESDIEKRTWVVGERDEAAKMSFLEEKRIMLREIGWKGEGSTELKGQVWFK